MKPITISYEYCNRNSHPMEILLAWPNESLYGASVNITELTHNPVKVTTRDHAGNQFAIVVVLPLETFRFEYQVMGVAKRRKELTESERQYYLEAEEMSKFPQQLQEMLVEKANQYQTDREKAYFFFEFLTREFAYEDFIFPSMRKRDLFSYRKLESLDFSQFFATLCRAVGIPARVVYGSFSSRFHRPHAWNEIYLEKEGWIPVDVGFGRIYRAQKKQADQLFLPSKKYQNMFGKLDEPRPIFGIQLELKKNPNCPIFHSQHQTPDANQLWGIPVSIDSLAIYPPPVLLMGVEQKTYFLHRLKRILYLLLVPAMAAEARSAYFFTGDWKVIRSWYWEWGLRFWIYARHMMLFAMLISIGYLLFSSQSVKPIYLQVAMVSGMVSHLIKLLLKVNPWSHFLWFLLYFLISCLLIFFFPL